MSLVANVVHILVFLDLCLLEICQVLDVEGIAHDRIVAVTRVHTAELSLL